MKEKLVVGFLRSICLCIMVGMTLFFYPLDCLADLNAIFFDVGAADCALIEVDGETMLVDTGYAKTWPHVDAVLEARGITEIDYLVATHPHMDHIGAIPDLLSEYPVKRALLPPIEHGTNAHKNMMEAIDTASVLPIYPQPGDSFTLGTADVIVYAPHPVAYDNLNDWSIVLMVKYAGRSILLTGDVQAAAEADMLANNDILPLSADILKVAHHGSDSSSTYPFIEAVMPQFAIVSCDSTQDREYPSVETAMTLFDCGVEDVYTTEKHGNVTVMIDSDGRITITTER